MSQTDFKAATLMRETVPMTPALQSRSRNVLSSLDHCYWDYRDTAGKEAISRSQGIFMAHLCTTAWMINLISSDSSVGDLMLGRGEI